MPNKTIDEVLCGNTPRTTRVVDALLDAGAKFRAVHPAQAVVMPNGQVVWLVSNAEEVAAGRQPHEFVDVLVPLIDTNRIDETIGKVLELGGGSARATAALSRAVADTIIGNTIEDIASGMKHVRIASGHAYFVREVARDETSGATRYAVVRDTTSGIATTAARADVVVDPRSHFGTRPVCTMCSTTDCGHAHAVAAFRDSNRVDIADTENKR